MSQKSIEGGPEFQQHKKFECVPPEPALEEEARTRSERLAELGKRVETLFPAQEQAALREEIKKSFDVPQVGKYHQEGMYMDRHLERILETIQDIKSGNFPNEVPAHIRQMMQEVAQKNEQLLQVYAFLHDIKKADSLTLKYQQGDPKQVSWDEWQASLPPDAKADPRALAKFCEEQGITGVSYYKHGEAGSQYLQGVGLDAAGIPPLVAKAIAKHEVAFSFQDAKPKTYEEHFGGLTQEEIAWVITASYSDTMGSLQSSGKPELKNFLAMVDSMHNASVIRLVEQAIFPDKKAAEGLDPQKTEKALAALRNENKKFKDSVEDIVARLKKECTFTRYDGQKLEEMFGTFVSGGQITEEEKNSVLGAFNPDTGLFDQEKMKQARSSLRPETNKYLAAILKGSEKKE